MSKIHLKFPPLVILLIWNLAKSHADSQHAPGNAEPNQNAYSNIKIGDVIIAADSKMDTLTLEHGENIQFTLDEINNKINISASHSHTGLSSTGNSASTTKLVNARKINGKLTWKRTRALYILGLDTEYDCTIPSGTNDILVVMAVGGASATTMPNNNKTTLLIPYPVLTGIHTISLYDNASTYLSIKVKFANNKITFTQQNTGSAWTGVRLFAEIYYR